MRLSTALQVIDITGRNVIHPLEVPIQDEGHSGPYAFYDSQSLKF